MIDKALRSFIALELFRRFSNRERESSSVIRKFLRCTLVTYICLCSHCLAYELLILAIDIFNEFMGCGPFFLAGGAAAGSSGMRVFSTD